MRDDTEKITSRLYEYTTYTIVSKLVNFNIYKSIEHG